ncbi:hydrogenase formation protein HypD [Planctomycetales bacterium ZRK34]|nr:hydrogenase formation protein HypD [Planctomycetales bacterium ZRK34]
MDMVTEALKRLREAAAAIDRPVKFMEVCGTHTMSAFRTGLHSLMPDNVQLLSGPGCPVCVTAQGDIDQLIELAADRDVTVCTYGDMMRVPGQRGSLAAARAEGADVRVVYSIMDAVRYAAEHHGRQVVFAAVGFETTAPSTAAAVLEAERQNLDNFSVLATHKRVLPAMKALLESGKVEVDGFLCPGHVSVIIGSEPYRMIVDDYHKPCVIGGFEDVLMAVALAALTEQIRDGATALVNLYPQAVTRRGNIVAQRLIETIYEPADTRWRGLGVIPQSGLVLKPSYQTFDAARRFELSTPEDHDPRGCLCGQVITGRKTPHECKLFARVCTPIHPIGPCMVSSEGTCQAWFKYNRGGLHPTPLTTGATRQ